MKPVIPNEWIRSKIFDYIRDTPQEYFSRSTRDLNEKGLVINPVLVTEVWRIAGSIKAERRNFVKNISAIPIEKLSENDQHGHIHLPDPFSIQITIDPSRNKQIIPCPDFTYRLVCDSCFNAKKIMQPCNECSGYLLSKCPFCEGIGSSEITEICPECHGDGVKQRYSGSSYSSICSRCKGKRKVLKQTRCSYCNGTGWRECKVCNGKGQIESICPKCNGKGALQIDFVLEVLAEYIPIDNSEIEMGNLLYEQFLDNGETVLSLPFVPLSEIETRITEVSSETNQKILTLIDECLEGHKENDLRFLGVRLIAHRAWLVTAYFVIRGTTGSLFTVLGSDWKENKPLITINSEKYPWILVAVLLFLASLILGAATSWYTGSIFPFLVSLCSGLFLILLVPAIQWDKVPTKQFTQGMFFLVIFLGTVTIIKELISALNTGILASQALPLVILTIVTGLGLIGFMSSKQIAEVILEIVRKTQKENFK